MTPSWRRPVDPYLTGGSGQSNKNGHSAWSHWKPSINKATRRRDSPVTPSSSEVSVFGGGNSSVWFVEVQSRDVADGLKKTTKPAFLKMISSQLSQLVDIATRSSSAGVWWEQTDPEPVQGRRRHGSATPVTAWQIAAVAPLIHRQLDKC